jgi:hypothetical protein
MNDTATVDLSEAATVVVPPPKADVPVLGLEHIVAADLPTDPTATGARAAELLDGLIAWHNRMPWAKRLRPDQVGQAGVVRFAFELPQAASGQAVLLKPLFTPEKLVAGQSAKQLLAFVRQHGLEASPAPADWPLRDLAPAGGGDTAAVHWRYLLSAAYPAAYGAVPLRALVGQPAKPGARVPVGGRRGLSLPRVGSAVGLVAGVLLAAVVGLRHTAPQAEVVAPAAAASAPQAKAPASAALPAAASAVALPAHEQASAAQAAGAPASAAPLSDTPQAGKASGHAGHDAAAKPGAAATPAKDEKTSGEPAAATAHGAETRPAASKTEEAADEAAKPPVESPLPKARPSIRPIHAPLETYDPTAKAKALANGQPEPVAKGPNFALVSAVSVDAEPLMQLRRRLRQAMGREGEALQLELQPAPGGQVLALWPITGRDSATRLADTLRQAGVRMRVVEF